jgi:DNA replication ATP-dependent helicase Dna2
MQNHNSSEIARLFYRKMEQIHESKEQPTPSDKLPIVFKFISHIYVYATQDEKLKFADLSTRIAFVGHKFSISNQSLYYVYAFRRYFLKWQFESSEEVPIENLYGMGLLALAESIKGITKQAVPATIQSLLPSRNIFKKSEVKIEAFKPFVRAFIIKDDENNLLLGIDEDNPTEEISIQYNIIGRNDFFNPSIQLMKKVFGFPVSVNLLDVEIDDAGIYRPKGFVILPDYLLDITSISECFTHNNTDPKLYLLKKFIPMSPNIHLAIGNTANYFLDELLSGSDAGFKELFSNIFTHNPIGFSTMDDREIREIYHSCQKHYMHLIDTIQRDFKEQGIDAKNSYLEPSFYSKEYGIQGRLDLWNQKEDGTAAIVELKSGKPFMPNKQGININHYIQTLLYDLLVKSVYGKKINPTNFILYSKVETSRLRFAKVSNTHQLEAMQVRNQIISIEYTMTKMDAKCTSPLQLLNMNRCQKWKGFHLRDLQYFSKAYDGLDQLEKKYFHTMCGFIAREHFTAKIGGSKEGNISGQANLWAKTSIEKQEDFEILSQLSISQFSGGEEEPIITFIKTPSTNPLANFRKGDICVLYPFSGAKKTVLNHQIFKCNIIEINPDFIQIRLRAKQHNSKIFKENEFWNMEHDLYDSSFTSQYKELLSFARMPKEKRSLFLGINAPSHPSENEVEAPTMMTENQQGIFKQIVNQGNLFLLWGPPGTGKTNMMLKNLVGYLLDNSNEHILLLTYTNRAADEICSAIESYHPEIRQQYYRIGSQFSTSEKYKERLLNNLIAECTNRKDVKQIIQQHRIVIATVSSMVSRKDLFKLKKFDRLIIDEASQITEPMLCGLLPVFPRVLMIGDHKQLPAVTTQREEDCLVNDPELNEIGVTDLKTSLFERLYLLYKKENYLFALGQLKEQGRMHQEIMAFPNEQFYEKNLFILPEGISYRNTQISPLKIDDSVLGSHRIIFKPVISNTHHLFEKTNEEEADKIVELIKAFKALYEKNNLDFNYRKIGVITPFRAQIACIRNKIQLAGIPTEALTIDTVERYQGGARDIILISVCANSVMQLGSIVSAKGDDTLDRKLNVALTRAKHHLVVVGNPEVLKYNVNYRTFMERYQLL